MTTPPTRPATPRSGEQVSQQRNGTAIQGKFTKDDIENVREELEKAFSLGGLIEDGRPVCPDCHAVKKVYLKMSAATGKRYWKCQKCKARGDAIELLQRSGMTFPEAVRQLIAPSAETAVPARLKVAPSFTATVDREVYRHVVTAGGLDSAADYYGIWHIAPEAVRAAGGRYLENPLQLQQDLLIAYGRDRLISCGVITVGDDKRDYFLFNASYPMVEPHLDPSGAVVGMQFRPSFSRREQVQAHKEFKRRWSGITDPVTGGELDPSDAWQAAYAKDPAAAGQKVRYVTPFLSLKGAGPESLVGCGLHLLAKLPPGQVVYVVEGFKDLLAARTMGANAYAIPGTGVMPGEQAIAVLRNHRVLVTLDGDEAGAKGREAVLAHLLEHGVQARAKDDMPPGMDVTDLLVQRHAHSGCSCTTCQAWRDKDPGGPECGCPACRKRH